MLGSWWVLPTRERTRSTIPLDRGLHGVTQHMTTSTPDYLASILSRLVLRITTACRKAGHEINAKYDDGGTTVTVTRARRLDCHTRIPIDGTDADNGLGLRITVLEYNGDLDDLDKRDGYKFYAEPVFDHHYMPWSDPLVSETHDPITIGSVAKDTTLLSLFSVARTLQALAHNEVNDLMRIANVEMLFNDGTYPLTGVRFQFDSTENIKRFLVGLSHTDINNLCEALDHTVRVLTSRLYGHV